MYILRNVKNRGAQEGIPLPGDVLVSEDFRKSFLVAPDHSHRRLEGEQHTLAANKAKEELAGIPARRARLAAIKRQLEGE